MGELRLQVREFQSLARWRWGADPAGLAWQYEAFTDLVGCSALAPDEEAS